MTGTSDRSPTTEHLREILNEVATQLLLWGATPDLGVPLLEVSVEAAAEGLQEVARIAADLAAKVSCETADTTALGKTLSSDFARLRQALDCADAETLFEPEAPAPASLAQDRSSLNEFIVESREHLAAIESRLLVLEQNPGDMELLHSTFRAFHSIKGLAGFLELFEIQEVAHEVETLLDLARNLKLTITPLVVDVVLESADHLKGAIDRLDASLNTGQPQPAEDASDRMGLLQRLRQTLSGETLSGETGPGEAGTSPSAQIPKVVSVTSKQEGSPAKIAIQEKGGGPEQSGSSETGAEIVADIVAKETVTPRQPSSGQANSPSVRVDTGKLDYLMDMVGEMVIAQSLIQHNPALASVADARLQRDFSHLARITGEVQRTTMSMRMIPVSQLFQRTARLVRDLARRAGKPVDLETTGEDTELDKTIAEELADPLMHMARNTIDHGLETPDERAAAGKNPVARVRLAAYHHSGQIVIEISDDGRGLDRDRILKKARSKGLIPEDAQLADSEILHLIFEPGFSTAEQVTEISGRGVGMDVVRRHVQRLRGRIDTQSKPGQGTTFALRLPLTLAIIDGLVVAVGPHRYIIPIYAVREMFRPTPDLLSTVLDTGEMALVRGRLLPIVRLHRYFDIHPRSEDPCQSVLVVAESEGRQFCLLIDDLIGKQEVVIKSLGESFKNISGIAGGAILGDGRVGLILDVDALYGGGRP